MNSKMEEPKTFYFTKSPQSILNNAVIPCPPGTQNFQHEVELAVALNAPVFQSTLSEYRKANFGYGCALDMTRRNLQILAREKQLQ